MSEKCPKCGANRTQFEGQTSWECGSYQSVIGGSHIHRPQFKLIEGAHCICRQQLAALAEENAKLKAEVKRLREGIEEIVYAYSDCRAVLEQPRKLIADLKALLVDGKEAGDEPRK